MLRVLIVDDEPAARSKLVRLLGAHADVIVVGTAANGREAVEAVHAHTPDLVLLDVRMPNLSGIEVVQALGDLADRSPQVVFITAFDEYAVQAFEVRALDYVLKPFDGERLGAALDRVRQQVELEHRPTSESLRSLMTSSTGNAEVSPPEPGRKYVDRMRLRSAGRSLLLSANEVEWVEAVGNYVRVHAGAERPMIRQTLSGFQAQLDPAHFCRIHRSAVVNVAHILEIKRVASGDGIIRLQSGMRLRLSRSYRSGLERILPQRLTAGRGSTLAKKPPLA